MLVRYLSHLLLLLEGLQQSRSWVNFLSLILFPSKCLFVRGVDMYAYDGNDFLSFDDRSGVWVAPIPEAQPTKRKWDGVQVLKEYTKGYLENEYTHLFTFPPPAPPEVSLYAKTSRVDADVVLTCLATGFYPADVVLRMKKNESVLTADDGLISSGVLPNEDHTFQRRDRVEVLRSDLSALSCEVVHEASAVSVTRVWGEKLYFIFVFLVCHSFLLCLKVGGSTPLKGPEVEQGTVPTRCSPGVALVAALLHWVNGSNAEESFPYRD
uniref:Ig-like domain-containing protein n=1 Tax=Haplochromis burtoni TaxID=8153 RepID=A0A3Q2W3L4_HAPBU